MGKREDMLRMRIEKQYGSIPKFCEASGLARSTVYNIFDRGVENTRTHTMDVVYAYVDMETSDADSISGEEVELLVLFRKMNEKQRAALLDTARAMAD